MSKTMDEALKRLAEKAKTLNARTDTANAVIEKANRELSAMSLGVEIWLSNVVLGQESVEVTGAGVMLGDLELGFAKVDGTWQLVTRLWLAPLDNHTALRALVKQDRDVRIKASAHVPMLIEAIAHRVDEILQATTDAAERQAKL